MDIDGPRNDPLFNNAFLMNALRMKQYEDIFIGKKEYKQIVDLWKCNFCSSVSKIMTTEPLFLNGSNISVRVKVVTARHKAATTSS